MLPPCVHMPILHPILREGPVVGDPAGDDRDLGVGQGRQMGGYRECDVSEDAGTQSRAQRRVAEAGTWRMGETSRWLA